jgi:hypothetical protein
VNNSLILTHNNYFHKRSGKIKIKDTETISHIDVNSKELNSFEAKKKIIQYYEINCEQISTKLMP